VRAARTPYKAFWRCRNEVTPKKYFKLTGSLSRLLAIAGGTSHQSKFEMGISPTEANSRESRQNAVQSVLALSE
jgi:hypothetical protein